MCSRLASHVALDLGELLGPEWDGFSLSADGLQHPYWRRSFTAGDFKAMFYDVQRVRILERDAARARSEAEQARAAQEAAEARAAFYRSQLVLESRMGMMLSALTHEE